MHLSRKARRWSVGTTGTCFESVYLTMDERIERLTGSLWLVTTPGGATRYTKCLGTVYRTRSTALAMRGPGEMVVELRLADSEED